MGQGITTPKDIAGWVWLTAALVATALSGLFIVLWMVGTPEALGLIGTRMKTNTAVGAFALCLAVLFLPKGCSTRSARGALASSAFAALGTAIGVLTLAQYAFEVNLGIDQLLAPGVLTEETRAHPNRMSPQAAGGFGLLGIGLLLLNVRWKGYPLGEPWILATFALALVALIGHGYQVAALYRVPHAIRISIETSTTLLLLSVAVLARRPDDGLVKLMRGQGTGALLVRRVLPVAILAPIALGWLAIALTRDRPTGIAMSVALLVLALITCFVAVILSSAQKLEQMDRRRAEVDGQLREALLVRDEFISVASHELKTPLAVMKLQLQLLRRRAGRPGGSEGIFDDPRASEKAHDKLEQQIRRLNRLVDDMLDVGRLNSGRMTMTFAPVQVGELVYELVEQLRVQAKAEGSLITLEGTAPVEALWDSARIEQVLSNLITNAIKYGAGKPIHIRLGTGEAGVEVSVQDFGIGIAPEQLERIFERFARAVPAGAFNGLGLGLYISRQIVDAHGGRLTAESQKGSGSCFRLLLPRIPEAARAQGAPVAVEAPDATLLEQRRPA